VFASASAKVGPLSRPRYVLLSNYYKRSWALRGGARRLNAVVVLDWTPTRHPRRRLRPRRGPPQRRF
jgi:hypothetical protein